MHTCIWLLVFNTTFNNISVDKTIDLPQIAGMILSSPLINEILGDIFFFIITKLQYNQTRCILKDDNEECVKAKLYNNTDFFRYNMCTLIKIIHCVIFFMLHQTSSTF
jgi:hypothetical protein